MNNNSTFAEMLKDANELKRENELENRKLAEIEQAKKVEMAAYAEIIRRKYAAMSEQVSQNIQENNEQIEKFTSDVNNYSTFDIKLIGQGIANFLTYLEEKEYVYIESIHHAKTLATNILGISHPIDKDIILKMVIVKGLAQKNYTSTDVEDTVINRLTSNNEAYLLYERSVFTTENNQPREAYITRFYEADGEDVKPTLRFENDALNRFIEAVIAYRINNNRKDISLTEIDVIGEMLAKVIKSEQTMSLTR